MMRPKDRKVVRYANVRDSVNDADLVLFRGNGLVSRLIRVAGRGAYSHAGMCVWARSSLLCCEVREFHGGRAVTLSSQVRLYPGCIDVYRTVPPCVAPGQRSFDATLAADSMLRKAGTKYGYGAVLKAGLLHLPFVRLWQTPDTDDESESSSLQYCSEAVASCLRKAGMDPTPNLSDRLTEPNDLARSICFQYMWTLKP